MFSDPYITSELTSTPSPEDAEIAIPNLCFLFNSLSLSSSCKSLQIRHFSLKKTRLTKKGNNSDSFLKQKLVKKKTPIKEKALNTLRPSANIKEKKQWQQKDHFCTSSFIFLCTVYTEIKASTKRLQQLESKAGAVKHAIISL